MNIKSVPKSSQYIDCCYVDGMNDIKHHKTIEYGEDDYFSQYLQMIYIQITVRNTSNTKRRRQKNVINPLKYPLKIPIWMKSDCVYPIRSKKDKVIFDGILNIKLKFKHPKVFKLLIDGLTRSYSQRYKWHYMMDVSDLIFNYYYDDTICHINCKQYLCDIFKETVIDKQKNKHYIVPSKRLNKVRDWLQKLNIIQYEDEEDEVKDESDNTCISPSNPNVINESLQFDESSNVSDSNLDNDWEIVPRFSWHEHFTTNHIMDYSLGEDDSLINKYDYKYKNKRSKDRMNSTLIQKSAINKHNNYAKKKNCKKYKNSFVDMDGIKIKIRSKRIIRDKYPRKETSKLKYRKRKKAEKNRKRSKYLQAKTKSRYEVHQRFFPMQWQVDRMIRCGML